MNDDKKRHFRERMEALHIKYCQQLPQKYQEIENSWKDYQSDFNNEDLFEKLYRYIHTLKGTAATFGFTKQADICFEIQQILTSIKEKAVSPQNSVKQIQEQLDQLKMNINTPAKDIE